MKSARPCLASVPCHGSSMGVMKTRLLSSGCSEASGRASWECCQQQASGGPAGRLRAQPRGVALGPGHSLPQGKAAFLRARRGFAGEGGKGLSWAQLHAGRPSSVNPAGAAAGAVRPAPVPAPLAVGLRCPPGRGRGGSAPRPGRRKRRRRRWGEPALARRGLPLSHPSAGPAGSGARGRGVRGARPSLPTPLAGLGEEEEEEERLRARLWAPHPGWQRGGRERGTPGAPHRPQLRRSPGP